MNNPKMLYAQSFEVIGQGPVVVFKFLQSVPCVTDSKNRKHNIGYSPAEVVAAIVMPADALEQLQGVVNKMMANMKLAEAEASVTEASVIDSKDPVADFEKFRNDSVRRIIEERNE